MAIDTVLNSKEVCEMLKISRTTLFRWMTGDPTFPAPIYRAMSWCFDASAIRLWVHNRSQQAQDAKLSQVDVDFK